MDLDVNVYSFEYTSPCLRISVCVSFHCLVVSYLFISKHDIGIRTGTHNVEELHHSPHLRSHVVLVPCVGGSSHHRALLCSDHDKDQLSVDAHDSVQMPHATPHIVELVSSVLRHKVTVLHITNVGHIRTEGETGR